MTVAIPTALLWGVRRHLAAPHAQIVRLHRQPFPGGFSGSRFEYWHLTLRRAGIVTTLTLVYKQGNVATGAFLHGAAQREAYAYVSLAGFAPLTLPTIVAVHAPAGEIWMLPFPPAKVTTHWFAAWEESDVREVISDLAHLHAFFHPRDDVTHAWSWLQHPTGRDAERLVADGMEGLMHIIQAGQLDDSLTAARVKLLLRLARNPSPLLDVLNAGVMTLLHGDAGFQNIAIRKDGRQRIWYDWQLVGWGPPALDWVTFLHPWAYPEAAPPLSFDNMTEIYLQELKRRGLVIDPQWFVQQMDAAFIWRWLVQWAPLYGKYRQRLRPEVKVRLDHVFARLHWPALERLPI